MPPDAGELVRDVLPRLRALDLWFKLPADLAGVVALCSGAAGRSQLGKVVTVYPADDASFVEAAQILDASWRPTAAPRPPSDLGVGSGGALSMRYGVVAGGDVLVDSLGRPHSAIRTPDGTLQPDDREAPAPPWAPPSPMTASAAPSGEVGRDFEIGGRRYVKVRALAARDGCTMYAALDVETRDVVLVRIAVAGVGADELGHDAATRLGNEHRLLIGLAGLPATAEVIDHDPELHVLITSDLGGRRLDQLTPAKALDALPGVARALADLHARGVVHRDVKAANIVVDDGDVRLVDLELGARLDDPEVIIGGSRGYLAPGDEYADPDPAADVYALGSTLTHVLLGSCPGRLPGVDNAARQQALLRLYGQPTGADLVASFTDPDQTIRPSAAEAADLLAVSGPRLAQEHGSAPTNAVTAAGEWPATAAVDGAEATRGFLVARGNSHYWRNTHHFAPYVLQGINLGAAGIMLGLCSIDTAVGGDHFARDIAGGAEWLAAQPPYEHAHGLFTGNAGVALALTVVGGRLDRSDLLAAGRERFTAATRLDHRDHDLFSGAAGVLWTGAMLSEVLDDSWPLTLAAPLAERLTASARPAGDLLGWPTNPDFDASETTYFGAAHGAAGIALALASWGRVADASTATSLAAATFQRLAEDAWDGDAFLSDSSGRTFQVPAWCHGATGLSWCLEQAFGGTSLLRDERAWARELVSTNRPSLADPTMCHGTAGSLETYRLLGLTERVHETVEVLRVLRQPTVYGETWGSENPATVTPDLWVGLLGPAAQLAMVAAGVSYPLLSPAWLACCVGA